MTKEAEKKFPLLLLVLGGASILILLVILLVDLEPNYSHLDARVLSGSEEGNYYAVGTRLSDAAAKKEGRLRVEATEGTVANLARLLAESGSCEDHFALVQDGIPANKDGIELVARLRKSESVFFVARDASRYQSFAELRGVTIAVGGAEGGTNHLVRTLFDDPDLRGLQVQFQNMDTKSQIAAIESGAVDLGAFVLDEDADLIRNLVRDRGLQLVSPKHLDVVARKFPFLWHGRIGAGQFDPVRVLPPSDVRVLRVDTLVVGNGCASRSEEIALLSLLAKEFPDVIEHNQKTLGRSPFPMAGTSERFFEEGGAGILDQHVPWLTAIMPVANWMYVIMVVSLLFNGMTFWHRFRLWRIDANRDKAEDLVRELFGRHLTAQEIHDLEPNKEHASDKSIALLDRAVAELTKLRLRSQKQANSMLVPMGQEGSYRFQEDQMEITLTALRHYRHLTLEEFNQGESSPDKGAAKSDKS